MKKTESITTIEMAVFPDCFLSVSALINQLYLNQ